MPSSRRKLVSRTLLSAGLFLAVSAVVLIVAALPERTAVPVQGALPTTFPQPLTSGPWLNTNNPKLGALFQISVHANPGSGVWILASANDGPATIAGSAVDLGPHWFVLQDLTFAGATGIAQLALPIPQQPSLSGVQFLVQSAVLDVPGLQLSWTDSALHRIESPQPYFLRVLIVRQGFPTVDAPFAPQAASQLAQMLQQQGIDVTMQDNVLPPDLSGFDCILDVRFDVPPPESEKLVLEEFLRHQGGVFFVAGPLTGWSWSIQRYSWVSDFVLHRLGIQTSMQPGGNVSWMSGEQVDPAAGFAYLNTPASISGLAYKVENEGGSFGPPGASASGSPWISSTGGWSPQVYGMLFSPAAITAFPVVGGVAVLFNGSPEAFTPGQENTAPDLVFANLCWWLDA